MCTDIKKMVSVMRTVNASTKQALLTERKNAELELGGPRGGPRGGAHVGLQRLPNTVLAWSRTKGSSTWAQ